MRLLKPDYQNAIADAIGDAVTDYLTSAAFSSEVPEARGREPYLEDAIVAAAVERLPARHRSRRTAKRTKAKAARPRKKSREKGLATGDTRSRAIRRMQSGKRRGAKSATRSRKRRR
jgi:hypothetical protein